MIEAIQRDNREWIGKYYLKKTVSFALEEKFTLSSEYFKEGLNLLTCDCNDGVFCPSETEYVEYYNYLASRLGDFVAGIKDLQ